MSEACIEIAAATTSDQEGASSKEVVQYWEINCHKLQGLTFCTSMFLPVLFGLRILDF